MASRDSDVVSGRWGKRLLAVLLVAPLLAACTAPETRQGVAPAPIQPSPSPEEPPPAPTHDKAFLGVVLPTEAIEIVAPFEGRVASLDVKPGDRVKAGMLMGFMWLDLLRSEEQMDEALLERAQAELQQAGLEANEATERLDRYLKPAPGVLSVDELSKTRYEKTIALSRLAAARASARERKAALDQVRRRIAEAGLRAPFDGVVAVRYLDPGAKVPDGAPLLRLLRGDGFRVRFAVPEDHSAAVAAGLPVAVLVSALGKEIPGTIESVAPEVDTASRMIFATATLMPSSESAGLRAGMVARVSLPQSAAVSPPPPPGAGGPPAKRSGE